MRPDLRFSRFNTRKAQAGLGLVSAIFVITVGALLAAAMASMMRVGQTATVQSFQATRAMQAAESGIQMEMVRLIQSSVGSACQSSNSYDFNTVAGLVGCNAATECSVSVVGTERYATIVSTGRCGGNSASLDSASRRLRVRAQVP